MDELFKPFEGVSTVDLRQWISRKLARHRTTLCTDLKLADGRLSRFETEFGASRSFMHYASVRVPTPTAKRYSEQIADVSGLIATSLLFKYGSCQPRLKRFREFSDLAERVQPVSTWNETRHSAGAAV